MNISLKSTGICLLLLSGIANAQVKQQAIPRVDQMADVPKPFQIIDYNKLALDFDKTVFDFDAKGKFWPLVWIDKSQKNYPQDVVGMYTAIGDVRQGAAHNDGMFHEALASMGATLGATLVGIDKTNQKKLNYVAMLKNYFSAESGWNIMMNNTTPKVALLGGGYGRDWWYDVYPNVMFYAIYDKYPTEPGLEEMARKIADKFYEADVILNGNYDYSYFDYGNMKPMKNNICAQPDAAAGHAWVLYMAYKKFGDAKYLKGAKSALAALQSQKLNPTYELLMPFGASLAARINAEENQDYDINKMLHWTFDGTPICREGWGVLVGNWNGIDISGIVGSTVDHGGYGFLMNTYDAAWPLVPIVRYNQSYANAIGKWMLNAANASKFFYPKYMPDEHEIIPQLASAGKDVIAYEGIIKQSNYPEYQDIKAPVAQGDGPLWMPGQNPPESQLSVYGSGHVGIFGSIIKPTTADGILQLDLLATDFFHDKAYPSYLYYNPFTENKTITVSVAKGKKVDLYDTVSGAFVAKNVSNSAKITLTSKNSAVLVMIPAKGKITYSGTKMLVNNVVVDYQYQIKK
ncbi:hypothetical protein FNO01nite_25570 [Flavobacterium noncentrifugens]|uniref:D-glucuronyl C5-epimerase C-terminal domain-containing protein n=1 Tax=Flavobacterium noncentrifugens TaxID=1128970 RepID=A0A1G8ZPE2_9FLAO|nr:hypothetical protein [Flavobacterium noncentrifugens]GEP51885.1 hypothetical protein FNO01nite_25570 [Flavobacterium noncentrifugens]SDK16921.1 hypothetical protein SAMN04487935_2685 [Flavobacterium noncentrifugens]